MRCANLVDTWTELADWLDQRDVLVLPPLAADLPLARLDAGCADVVLAVGRLRRLIEHFAVRAVHVHVVDGVPAGADEPEPAAVAVRALAAGGGARTEAVRRLVGGTARLDRECRSHQLT